MKKFSIFILLSTASICTAQNSRFKQKMAPVYESGYYVSLKGDTVFGEVQSNPESETDFYCQFYFKSKGKAKPRQFLPQRITKYGFGDRHFVLAEIDGKKQYVERLADGRLKFFEFKYPGKVDGYAAVDSEYFIKDTRAEGENAELKELRKIPKKFYKKALKPYLADQPMIWSDLDKYTFDKSSVLSSIKEFNKYYTVVAN